MASPAHGSQQLRGEGTRKDFCHVINSKRVCRGQGAGKVDGTFKQGYTEEVMRVVVKGVDKGGAANEE